MFAAAMQIDSVFHTQATPSSYAEKLERNHEMMENDYFRAALFAFARLWFKVKDGIPNCGQFKRHGQIAYDRLMVGLDARAI